MNPPLHMVRLPIDLARLATYADDRGWIRRRNTDGRETDASFDAGRALHHVLDETFGQGGLKPFRLMAPRSRSRGSIYAYSSNTKQDLLTTARETAPPEATSILGLDHLDTREMPGNWPVGRRLAFDTRVRPVVRIKSPLPDPRRPDKPYQPGAELDAFLVEANRQHPEGRPRIVDGKPTASEMIAAGRTREAVYLDWLSARLEGAAELDRSRTTMVEFERSRVARNGKPVEGPDATFHGHLTITNPTAFETLLARGVGRHRSFGFGMLVLRPPSRG